MGESVHEATGIQMPGTEAGSHPPEGKWLPPILPPRPELWQPVRQLPSLYSELGVELERREGKLLRELMFLCDHLGKDGIWRPRAKLAKSCGLETRSVDRVIARVKRKGLLKVVHNGPHPGMYYPHPALIRAAPSEGNPWRENAYASAEDKAYASAVGEAYASAEANREMTQGVFKEQRATAESSKESAAVAFAALEEKRRQATEALRLLAVTHPDKHAEADPDLAIVVCEWVNVKIRRNDKPDNPAALAVAAIRCPANYGVRRTPDGWKAPLSAEETKRLARIEAQRNAQRKAAEAEGARKSGEQLAALGMNLGEMFRAPGPERSRPALPPHPLTTAEKIKVAQPHQEAWREKMLAVLRSTPAADVRAIVADLAKKYPELCTADMSPEDPKIVGSVLRELDRRAATGVADGGSA